jgi:hypothetical protein
MRKSGQGRVPHLGIEPLGELERALDVGEEDRDLLALALERTAQVEDPLREVERRVRARVASRRVESEPSSAAGAEAVLGPVRAATLRAGGPQGRRQRPYLHEAKKSRQSRP